LDITPFTLPPFDTTLAVWEPFDFNYSINENNELRLKMRGYDPDGDGTVGYWESTWLNFLYGHGEIELLAPPDNFSFNPYTGDFIWRNPPGPGRYLLGFDLVGVTADLQNPNNRFSRYLIIELTEEDFMLNTRTRAVAATELKIHPNPTTTTTTLEYGGLNGEIYLKAINAQGQIMLQKTLNGTAQIQREVIDVSTWPAGVYWIELSNEQGQVTKKLVVE
jgi:hypothetical protein